MNIGIYGPCIPECRLCTHINTLVRKPTVATPSRFWHIKSIESANSKNYRAPKLVYSKH